MAATRKQSNPATGRQHSSRLNPYMNRVQTRSTAASRRTKPVVTGHISLKRKGKEPICKKQQGKREDNGCSTDGDHAGAGSRCHPKDDTPPPIDETLPIRVLRPGEWDATLTREEPYIPHTSNDESPTNEPPTDKPLEPQAEYIEPSDTSPDKSQSHEPTVSTKTSDTCSDKSQTHTLKVPTEEPTADGPTELQSGGTNTEGTKIQDGYSTDDSEYHSRNIDEEETDSDLESTDGSEYQGPNSDEDEPDFESGDSTESGDVAVDEEENSTEIARGKEHAGLGINYNPRQKVRLVDKLRYHVNEVSIIEDIDHQLLGSYKKGSAGMDARKIRGPNKPRDPCALASRPKLVVVGDKEFTSVPVCIMIITTIRVLTWENLPGPFRTYNLFPLSARLKILRLFLQSYTWEGEQDVSTCFDVFENIAADAYQRYLLNLRRSLTRKFGDNKEAWKNHSPVGCSSIENWKGLCAIWASPEWSKESQTGKSNRTKHGRGECHHLGSRSFYRTKKALEKERGPGVPFEDVIEVMHTKTLPDGTQIVSPKAKETVEIFETLRYMYQKEGIPEVQAWVDVAGGVQRGKVFGLGNRSVTLQAHSATLPRRAEPRPKAQQHQRNRGTRSTARRRWIC